MRAETNEHSTISANLFMLSIQAYLNVYKNYTIVVDEHEIAQTLTHVSIDIDLLLLISNLISFFGIY